MIYFGEIKWYNKLEGIYQKTKVLTDFDTKARVKQPQDKR